MGEARRGAARRCSRWEAAQSSSDALDPDAECSSTDVSLNA